MTYALHLGMPAQIFDNLDSVGYVSLNAQRKRFEALEQQKGVEGRYTGAFVAEYHGADTVDKSCFGRYFGKNGSVVVGVGLGECGETAGEAEVIEIPPSTMTPPSVEPWPPMNFVAECITMSAPCSIGRMR